MKRETKSIHRTGGTVIVLVLGCLLLVAGLLTSFVTRAGTDLVAAARTSDDSLLRREAYSALETTLAVLAEFQAVDGALYSPAQGWQNPLEYAGDRIADGLIVGVSFSDETGKLSLPNASLESVERLLEYCGVEPGKIRTAADALLAWVHPNQTSTGAGPPAPVRPRRAFGEIASISVLHDQVTDAQGRPNEVWARLVDSVTLRPLAAPNLNTAQPAVLYALGWTREQIAMLKRHRDEPNRAGYRQSVEDFALPAGMGGTLGTRIEALRIGVTVRSAGAAFRLDATIAIHSTGPAGGGLQYPFQIVEFHENPAKGLAEP